MNKIGMQLGIDSKSAQQDMLAGLASFLPKGAREVNEEQLFIGLVSQQLEKKKAGLGQKFNDAVQKELSSASSQSKKGKTAQLEDLGQKVLNDLEKDGSITKSERESILKKAWTAAQLDDNPALWDSRGGKNDPTIAKSTLADAQSKVQKNLDAIQSGSLKLIEPTTVTNSPASTRSVKTGSVSIQDAPSGFLWKPITENSGTAAVLFDSEIAKNASSVELVGPDGKSITTGRFTSFGDDGKRGKYVFGKAGSSYPSGSQIVITLNSGEKITVALGDPAKRLEKK
jgi:hypothetical protein